MSVVVRTLCAAAAIALLAAPTATASSAASRQVVTYRSLAQLERSGARVVRTLPALRMAVVEADLPLGARPDLRRALSVDEPALETYLPGVAWEWQWEAARKGEVLDWVLRAAVGVTIRSSTVAPT